MKVLFLGLGGVGQRHLRNLKTLRPDAEIIAVRHVGRRFVIGPDLKADNSQDVEAKFNIRRADSIAQALADGPLALAVVASPSSLHMSQALELARSGVPVLLEKPISHDHHGLNELTALSRQGASIAVAYMLRWHPLVRQLRDWLANGVVGQPVSVQASAQSYMPSWHGYESYDSFYAGRRDLGGGVILTEIHIVDLLYSLFGLPETLWSVGGTLSGLNLDVEDTVSTLLAYRQDGGCLPVSLSTSFVQRPPQSSLTINGRSGRIHLDLTANTLAFHNLDTGAHASHSLPPDYDRNDLFVAELRDFLDAIDQGHAPETALHQVVDGHRLALAIFQSLTTGHPINPKG